LKYDLHLSIGASSPAVTSINFPDCAASGLPNTAAGIKCTFFFLYSSYNF